MCVPSKNELAANLLAKKMITDELLVPDYLHATKSGNIESHSHVFFLVPHAFQVFRQIDESTKLDKIIKDINDENSFTKHKDNEFVKILKEYGEETKYGKIILKSLVETYKNALKNKKYKAILGRLGVIGKSKDGINEIKDGINEIKDGINESKDGINEIKDGINEIRGFIAKYKDKFYKDWDSCVDARYDFYKEVEKEYNLFTKDFFTMRSFAMGIFTSLIVIKKKRKKN